MRWLTIFVSSLIAMISSILLYTKGFRKGKDSIINKENEKTLEKIEDVKKDQNERDNDDIDTIIDRVCNVSRKTK